SLFQPGVRIIFCSGLSFAVQGVGDNVIGSEETFKPLRQTRKKVYHAQTDSCNTLLIIVLYLLSPFSSRTPEDQRHPGVSPEERPQQHTKSADPPD
ncbi:MAG: hypothetical protein AB2812_14775, partial [Candidatus Sedimenticola endophacoides]